MAAFPSPQVPSRSLSSLSVKTRKDTPERSRRVATYRYSRPIGRLSQCAANRAVPAWRGSRSSASEPTSQAPDAAATSTLRQTIIGRGSSSFQAKVLSATDRSTTCRPPNIRRRPGVTSLGPVDHLVSEAPRRMLSSPPPCPCTVCSSGASTFSCGPCPRPATPISPSSPDRGWGEQMYKAMQCVSVRVRIRT